MLNPSGEAQQQSTSSFEYQQKWTLWQNELVAGYASLTSITYTRHRLACSVGFARAKLS